MKIIKLSYIASNWELQNLDLGKVNLVVGKNTVGKSVALQTILMISHIISQRRFIDEPNSPQMEWELHFEGKEGALKHHYQQNEGNISEEIFWNGTKVMTRQNEEATLMNFFESKQDKAFPPANKLLIHTLRDVKKYPFLEPLAHWAENIYGIRFASVDRQTVEYNSNYPFMGLLTYIPNVFKDLPTFNKEKVKMYLNQVGYPIEKIETSLNETQPSILFVKEKGIKTMINHIHLSQGLMRALYLFIFLEYVFIHKKDTTLLIDDLCEGLDYDRATKLGKIVFETCEQNDIQLLATSNDSFLMEVVDIKNWNILQRNGQIVTSINNQNNPDLFKEFRFTGMSNFDLLASDFITQKIAKI